ncbi:MAG: oligosaccharide flippase family protein, partial [Melioribacteraceae bacterium]|nr:oligosaccharide flippase family protein [Melioribacteraceae bacterium]
IKLSFDKAVFRRMFQYALPLVIVGVAGVINQLIDRFLVKELLPGSLVENLSQSGIYNACVKIAVLMLLFTTAFNYAAEPFFFKNADRKDAQLIYAKVGQAFAIVGSIVFLVISLYIDIFQYLIGRDFREGLGIVPILLMAYLFLGLYYNFSIWYKLKDKTHYGAMIASAGAVITLLLNFILVPEIGYYGSSIASLACFAAMCAMAIYFGRKFYPIPYPLLSMGKNILLAVILYGISFGLGTKIDNTILLLLSNTILLVIFIVFILKSQRNLIQELLGIKTS